MATPRVSIRRRLWHLIVSGVVSSLPLALWLLRNRMTGTMVGGHVFRPASMSQLLQSLLIGTETLVPWFFTERVPSPASLIAVGLIFLLARIFHRVLVFSDRQMA